jgi:hypothetical protein
MIEIPEQYRIGRQGKQLNKQGFFSPTFSAAEKRRLRECLLKVVLTHQITGEAITSRIDAHYRCEVIACISIELSDLKHKDFVAKLLQPLMKPFVIYHLHDTSGNHALSFAHKRLNKTDPSSIVIADAYCTAIFTRLDSRAALAFPALVNRTSKRDLYLEAMTKAFLLDHPKLFIGADKLLDAKLWYRGESIIVLYEQMVSLRSLKAGKSSAKTNAEKSRINESLKAEIGRIKADHFDK